MEERIEDLFPLYALGALNDDERARVDAYVAGHSEARAQLAEFVRTSAALPHAVTPIEPSAQVKQKVLARVEADARTRVEADIRPRTIAQARSNDVARSGFFNRLRTGWGLPVLTGLSVVAAILALAWGLALNSEVTRLRAETAALQHQIAVQSEVLARISLPDMKTIDVAGTEHQPAAHGQLIANPRDNSAVLIVAGLAQLQPGKVYQFWLIRGQSPVSAGIFSVDDQGRALLPVTSTEAVGSFDAVGVSIEPAGGSPQPTGDIVMLGHLS